MSAVVGRIGEVDQRFGDHPEVEQVRVGVDEAGQHRGAVEVDDVSVRAASAPDVVIAADGGDAPIGDGYRFGDGSALSQVMTVALV